MNELTNTKFYCSESEIKDYGVDYFDKQSKKKPNFLFECEIIGEDNSTLLMAACKIGKLDLVKYFIDKTDNNYLDRFDVDGKTALHYAIESNSYDKQNENVFECVKMLLEAGADLNANPPYNSYGKNLNNLHYFGSPLFRALYNSCDKDVVDLLLNGSADYIDPNLSGGIKGCDLLQPYKDKRFIDQWSKSRLILIGYKKNKKCAFSKIPADLIVEIFRCTFPAWRWNI